MLYPCYGGMPNGGIAMHHTEEYKNHDELKGRFTVWLEKVVRNAKITAPTHAIILLSAAESPQKL